MTDHVLRFPSRRRAPRARAIVERSREPTLDLSDPALTAAALHASLVENAQLRASHEKIVAILEETDAAEDAADRTLHVLIAERPGLLRRYRGWRAVALVLAVLCLLLLVR